MRTLTLMALISLFSWGSLGRFWRETNSEASAKRGVKQFHKGSYSDAEKSFKQSAALRSDPTTSFNVGTSQVAAGHFEEGSETLSKLTQDPALRADAYYNRGNSALGSKAYDYAIRDYSEALKLRPSDIAAKRNLEIALKRKAESTPSPSSKPQQQQQQQQQQSQQKPQQGGKQNPDSGSQQPKPKTGQADVDALLRSVQQQEKEELSRMKHAHTEGKRVGW